MNLEDAEQLVKDIVEQASLRKDLGNLDKQLWRQGYLIGLLAQLAADDSYVRHDLEARLKRLDPHKR